MNTNPTNPDHDEAQWQAQERARIAIRHDNPTGDAGDLRVARALRQAPRIALPVDFAAQMAGLVRVQAANNSLFEQRLLRGLSVMFALSALITVAWYGRSWPADLAAALPGGSEAVSWSTAAGLCVLGNWAFALVRRQLIGHGAEPT